MAIELSSLMFTNQADVVPMSGVEEILNTGIANTLAGNDKITGTGTEYNFIRERNDGTTGFYSIGTGFYNIGTLNTADGNDTITGIHSPIDPYNPIGLDRIESYGILNEAGTIDTGNGNDIITGISEARISDGSSYNNFGIHMGSNSTIDTGNGNDTITGSGLDFGILNWGTIHTDDGNDLITGAKGDQLGSALHNLGVINTGDGNDRITGITKGEDGIFTSDTIDTGNGDDIITGIGTRFGIENYGTINTGNGNDSIIAEAGFDPLIGGDNSIGNNGGTINTGNGNDSIISKGRLYNTGVIFLGEGNDSFIADGVFDGSGDVFLGNGQDDFKGFGSGNFYGGNGKDTLKLASGNYTIGISGATVNFTKGSTIMITSEFEKLIAGSTTYNFSSLTNGQTIFVA
jgi:Ca2+-binding RTX toxin-like protein